ncbi:MAG: hypothetical protein AABW88_01970 [Nanoarchaeota archaeon]
MAKPQNDIFKQFKISGARDEVSDNVRKVQALVRSKGIEVYEASLATKGMFSPKSTYQALLYTPAGLVVPVSPSVTVNELRAVNHGVYAFGTDRDQSSDARNMCKSFEETIKALGLEGSCETDAEYTDGSGDRLVRGIASGRLEVLLDFMDRVRQTVRKNKGFFMDIDSLTTSYQR